MKYGQWYSLHSFGRVVLPVCTLSFALSDLAANRIASRGGGGAVIFPEGPTSGESLQDPVLALSELVFIYFHAPVFLSDFFECPVKTGPRQP